jgi:hypothetical protein
MAKYVVKLALNRKSIPQKIEFGRLVESSMTLNPNFATPNPTPAMLNLATDELEVAFNAAQVGGPLETATMYEKETAWDTLVTALGNYVDNIAQGVQTIILSAGMETKRLSTPVGIPARVVNVAATSVNSGELLVKWKSVYGARAYLGYIKVDGEDDSEYQLLIKVTRAKATVTGLISGTKYVVVVEAVGAAGTGALSDTATSVVL